MCSTVIIYVALSPGFLLFGLYEAKCKKIREAMQRAVHAAEYTVNTTKKIQ